MRAPAWPVLVGLGSRQVQLAEVVGQERTEARTTDALVVVSPASALGVAAVEHCGRVMAGRLRASGHSQRAFARRERWLWVAWWRFMGQQDAEAPGRKVGQ